MAKASALDHFVLVVSDVERSLAWFQRHLRLDGVRLEEWRSGEAPFPSLRVDSSTIIDFVAGEPGEGGHLDHICFVVSQHDVDEIRRAGELTVLEEGPRFGARGIADSVYVKDPDGLIVELRAYPD